ncbi:MAG: hypothetical protein N2383_02575 [Caldilineales bacterium]|nr:hypothetical protein [Caldilineales bacterium]
MMAPWSFALLLVATALAGVWWVRRGRRGRNWLLFSAPLAFVLSYLSGFLFRVPEYQVGCPALCPGWQGHPVPIARQDVLGDFRFDPPGFVLNSLFYEAFVLLGSLVVVRLAELVGWSQRSRRWRVGYVALTVVMPLALAPVWLPPPQPDLPSATQRLAINAARDWRWQLQGRRLTDYRLAVEDVRRHPDGSRWRVCFRVYSWFYRPRARLYIDLEPAGVRATGGGLIPLTASCWVQP